MLPFFDCRAQAHGIIAIGGEASGIIAIGQMATGVIAIGQLARGGIAIGQLALGVVTIGQGAGGLLRSWGMLAVGARASGLLKLSIVPQPPEQEEVPVIPVAAVIAGEQSSGWIRVTAIPDGGGGINWMEDGVPVQAEIRLSGNQGLLRGLVAPRQLLVSVVDEEVFDDQSVHGLRTIAMPHRRLRADDVKFLDGGPPTPLWSWVLRGIVGLILALVVGQFALRPVIELFMS